MEAVASMRALEQYLCSLSVEDLLAVRWYLSHRHNADLAQIDEAIRLEEGRREQRDIAWKEGV